MIEITLNIPALNRLCDLVEKGVTPFAGASVSSTEKTGGKPKAESKSAPKAEPKPDPKDEALVHTVETITEKARELISLSSPATLRKLLDDTIGKNIKIGEAKEKDFPKLAEAIEAAITSHKDSGL